MNAEFRILMPIYATKSAKLCGILHRMCELTLNESPQPHPCSPHYKPLRS